MSTTKLVTPERERICGFKGTNASNLIHDIDLVDIDGDETLWKVTWSDKQKLYGASNMIKVGNRTEGVEGTPLIRTPDSLEPFCFWSWPTSLLKCILHAHCVKFCIDVHASDGRLAWACWQLGIVYVGICFNEDHAQALEERLKQLFLDHLADPSQEMKKIYNPRYAALIGHTQQTQKDPDHKDLETPRPRKSQRGTYTAAATRNGNWRRSANQAK